MKFIFSFFIAFGFCSNLQAQSLCKQHLHNSGNALQNNNTQRSIASQNTDVTYYRCYFENTPNVRFIKGYVVIHFKATQTANSISFDLKSNLTVDSVKFRGANMLFTRPTDALQISLSAAVATGAKDSVQIFYQGAPLTTEGYFATGTHSAAPITYTLSEPYGARYWWPCKDDVVDKADSIDILLKYPATYIGVANGILANETNDGTNKISNWKHRKPIAAYLMAFAITNYNKQISSYNGLAGTIQQINYVYPESIASYTANIAKVNTALALFESKFGPYPFSQEQYTQTQIQNGVGGMEHQTNSFIDSWGGDLMAHELLHQWFGDMVTCNTWKDIWLNEGFASYGEVMFAEQNSGFAAAVTEMKTRATTINAITSGSVYCNDTSTVGSIFNYRLTYLKASYAVHMLRWQLGDAPFYQACKNYLNAPSVKYGFATTDTLKKYMEAGLTAGGNLTEFFNDFVYGQGYPTYAIEWNQVGSNVIIKANQTSSNAAVSFYEMPIPVRLIGASRDTIVRLNHTSSGQLFNFPLSFTVTSAQFDPDAWILSKGNTASQNTALSITAISNIVTDTKISIGPNPANNYLYINNNSNRIIMQIQIWNAQGQLIKNYTKNLQLINVQNIATGKYIVKIIDANKNNLVYTFVKN
jgi:aminopeptidase N